MTEIECRFATKEIPVEEFMRLSGVVKDYLAQDEKLQPFISTYCTLDALEENIQARQHFDFRQELVHVLKEQNKTATLHDLQHRNIELFANEHTFCVTTAHQTNLLGGPLYFIQKAISAISICAIAKERYPQYNFVPMYWLGTEDHDFEELNHTSVFGTTLTWQDEQGGAVGRYNTESLTSIKDQLSALFGSTKNDTFLNNVFEEYFNQPNIAEGTRYLLNTLLGEYGLLVIDGDDETLKRRVIPVFERELTEQFAHKAAQKAIDFLESEYGKSQAHAREINLFYLTDNSRKRIVTVGDSFGLYGTTTTFTKEELLQELHEHPTRFSPNVMLRPLMQELCLPNLMYVGGGGETSYWFQLKPIFDAVNCPYPMLGLRDTAVYVSKKAQHKIEKLGLTINQFAQPKQELEELLVKKNTTNELELTKAKQLIEEATKLLQNNALAVDQSLNQSALASQQKIINELTKFENKLFRAEKRNHTTTLEQLNTVYNELYPSGKLQERYENFSQYYSVYGKDWLTWQLNNFNLFTKTVKVCLFD